MHRLPTAMIPLVIALSVLPTLAHAQAGGAGGGGGGGGTMLSGLLTQLTGTIGTTLISLAIVGVGFSMFLMRLNFVWIACVCVGSWIILNYQTVQGWM